MDLTRNISKYMKHAADRVKKQPGVLLEGAETEARAWVWSRHQQELTKLFDLAPCLRRDSFSEKGFALFTLLRNAMEAAAAHVRDMAHTFKSIGSIRHVGGPPTSVTVACANPSRQGCANLAGTMPNYTPLTIEGIGLHAAVHALDIDIIGLTAPRLQEDLRRLPGSRMHVHCKGGFSYGSTGLAWQQYLNSDVVVIPEIGSKRRLWHQVGVSGKGGFRACVVQLPTTADAAGDDAWCEELEGLDADLRHLAPGGCLERAMLYGDWNFQPDSLGGGKEPRRRRQAEWDRLSRIGATSF